MVQVSPYFSRPLFSETKEQILMRFVANHRIGNEHSRPYSPLTEKRVQLTKLRDIAHRNIPGIVLS